MNTNEKARVVHDSEAQITTTQQEAPHQKKQNKQRDFQKFLLLFFLQPYL